MEREDGIYLALLRVEDAPEGDTEMEWATAHTST